jgi:hypothetical protein
MSGKSIDTTPPSPHLCTALDGLRRAAGRIGTALAIAVALVVGTVSAANAEDPPKVQYTNRTKVKRACPIHWNHPHRGVADRTWPAGPATDTKVVGVRYTAGDYAMVRDGGRQRAQTPPWWGWIRKSCLVDPVARKLPRVERPRDLINRKDPESYAPRVRHHYAVGGDYKIKYVDTRPGPGHKRGRVTVGDTGTLRNGPMKFAIGNVEEGWVFRITRHTCRRADGRPYEARQWVFGYSPDARRWGWVQARHLPECTGGRSATAAAATPASSTAAPPASAPVAAGAPMCHWKVTWPAAGVYEDPNRSWPPLKSKHSGDVVGPFCTTHFNLIENETYVQVRTESAADGIGWMRLPALNPV